MTKNNQCCRDCLDFIPGGVPVCIERECKCHTSPQNECKHKFWKDRNPPECLNCGKNELELGKNTELFIRKLERERLLGLIKIIETRILDIYIKNYAEKGSDAYHDGHSDGEFMIITEIKKLLTQLHEKA